MSRYFPLFFSSFFIFCSFVANAASWTQRASLPSVGHVHGIGFSIGSKGYMGLGPSFNDFWEWDGNTASPTYNTWTQKANYPSANVFAATGFSIGNKGYVGFGGQPGGNDFWEFDPAANLWTRKADFSGIGRNSATGFSIGSKGYVGTGHNGAFQKDFWEYDPADMSNGLDAKGNPMGSWSQKADFGGGARNACGGFSIGKKGYIGTGNDGVTLLKDFWEYDPSDMSNGLDAKGNPMGAWIQKAPLPPAAPERNHPVAFSIGTKGYIGTGGSKPVGAPLADFWEWDQATNTWTQKPDHGGGAIRAGVGFSIGNRGYIGMGSPQSDKLNPTNNFWEYSDPNVTCPLTISVFADPTSICTGNTIAIYASGGSTYSWNTGSTASHITEKPTVTTVYSVTGTSASGCTGTATITVTVQDCVTGIFEESLPSLQVIISPNPFSESAVITLRGAESTGHHELQIIDLMGNVVQSTSFTGKQTIFERGFLADGIYFYKLISGNNNVTEKLMIGKF